MLYQISQGAKSFGSQLIFRQLQFEIRGNEKIAVVGPNGSGKTTLLKIISGEIDLDEGVIHRSNQIRLGVLSQTSFTNEDISVEAAFSEEFAYIHKMQEQLEVMHVAFAGGSQ
jgi:ATP-binding cassette, subfamily F, member 3